MTARGPDRWLEQAREDLEVGHLLVDEGRFEHAAFLLQQAVEKALKAVQADEGEGLTRTHDCFVLAKDVNAPREVIEAADEVTPYYMRTRYPDAADVSLRAEDLDPLVDAAEEVIAWSRKTL